MHFEWDEAKRHSNKEKHGLDFLDVFEVFDGPHVVVPSRHDSDEERQLAVGLLDGRFVTVVYTFRESAIRVISFRRARYEERRKHHELFGL